VGLFRARTTRRSASLSIVPVLAAVVLALGVSGASGQAGRGASASAAASLTLQSMPSPAHAMNFINAISCASASSCMAVGSSTRHGDVTHALTEHWNGARWSIVPTPRIPDTLATTVFNGVSCPAQNFCLGVGYFDRQRTLYPLAESWNGRRWSLQLPSNQGGAFAAQLESVSCPSTRACVAVGLGGTRSLKALVERWNGHGWTATTRRPFPHGSSWTAVSCVSADACMAVAGAWSGTFNGRRWTIHEGPGVSVSPSSAQPSPLSCASASSCMVVGQSSFGRPNGRPVAAYWNGRGWTKQSVPYPPPPPGAPPSWAPNSPVPECTPGQSYQYTSPSSLTGVSCLASNSCQAIGSAVDSQDGLPAMMAPHWDGSSWSTPAPPRTPRYLVFGVVSCVSGDVCEIAGATETSHSTTLEAARYG
jgi:hypothetical protein